MPPLPGHMPYTTGNSRVWSPEPKTISAVMNLVNPEPEEISAVMNAVDPVTAGTPPPRRRPGVQRGWCSPTWSLDEAVLEEVHEACEVVFELSGEGVLDVDLAKRHVGPLRLSEGSIIIGRKHQPDILRRAVAKNCLQCISRNHFRIGFSEGRLMLTALSYHPIWRERDGHGALEVNCGESVPLAFGDRVVLGSGTAATVEEARRWLCWRFCSASSFNNLPVSEKSTSMATAGQPFCADDDGRISFGQVHGFAG